jgi:hypothetical protein
LFIEPFRQTGHRTDAFSKGLEHASPTVALYVYDNVCRVSQTLCGTPAREARLTFYRVELRDHGPVYGVEAQFVDPVDLRKSRTFRSFDEPTGALTQREMAIAWAIEERKAMERGD